MARGHIAGLEASQLNGQKIGSVVVQKRVQDSFVDIGGIGDKRFLPRLRARIERGVGKDRTRRPLYHAVNAYARISGVDLRPEKPETMDVLAVAERYREHFEKLDEKRGK